MALPVPRTLYAKLSLGLVALLAAIGLVYSLLSLSASRHYLEEVNQTLNRDLARNLVRDRNLVQEGRIDEAALKETFLEYMTINPSIEIYLLDLDGRILSFSADPGKVKRKMVSLEPIDAFLGRAKQFPLLGDDPRSHDRRKAFSVTPVPTAAAPEGYLYVVLRGERYDSVDHLIEESYLLRLSAWAVAGSLGFGLLAGLVVFHLLTRRLHQLTGLMDRFRHSGFLRHEPFAAHHAPSAGDEIDRLGASFDEMAQRIIEQLDDLHRQDELRRELVAHVSHDLRTPLAALHGYLETLRLKEKSLTPPERAEHLDVALRHSERLVRLVAELFELAKLDAKEREPKWEPFSVPDLMQDIAQKFRLRSEQSGTALAVEVAGDVPLASGDVGLIERVMENLIDNAFEHTPAGGRIRIPVRPDGDLVSVAVQDAGAGIAPEDLPRIFDRFYQGGEGRAGGHAGLGLAIAKRIVELHGASLDVHSEPGRGACFSFSLPACRDAALSGAAGAGVS